MYVKKSLIAESISPLFDEELGLQARLAPAGGSIALLGHTAQLIICQGFVPTTGLSLVLECRSSDYTGSSGPGVWEPVAHSLWSWHMLSGLSSVRATTSTQSCISRS